MTTHPAASLRDRTDRTAIHQVDGIAPQHGPAAVSDASGTPATCSREEDELADPEIIGRNASGWSAGG